MEIVGKDTLGSGLPSILVAGRGEGSAWNEEGGGSAESVGGGGFVAVVGVLEIAGDGVVLGIFEVAVGPAVGAVGTQVGSSWSAGCGGGWHSGSWRRRDGAWSRRWACHGGCVGVACAAAGGGEATILVGGAKVEDEVGEGLGGFGFRAPFTARDFEKAGSEDDVVAETNDRGCAGCIVAGGSKADAVVELSE